MSGALAVAVAFALLAAIAAYSTAGGVDFGAGIWDLLAGRDAKAPRELIDQAMAPVWEVNNVWLVFALVVTWTGFPLLFESVFPALYPLFVLALLGLILRGAFFAFRHVAVEPGQKAAATVVFGAASLLTPFFFAATLGAIASGRVSVGGPRVPLWEACVSPMSVAFGLVSLAATAFIGATFLVGDARRGGATALVEYFRRRAMAAGLALMVLGTAALGAIAYQAPDLLRRMVLGPGLPFTLAVMALTPLVVLLVWRRRYLWYRLLAAGAVGSLVLAWGFAQSPYLLPGQLTVSQAAAPQSTLALLVGVTVAVIAVIAPALGLLLWLDQRSALESPH